MRFFLYHTGISELEVFLNTMPCAIIKLLLLTYWNTSPIHYVDDVHAGLEL